MGRCISFFFFFDEADTCIVARPSSIIVVTFSRIENCFLSETCGGPTSQLRLPVLIIYTARSDYYYSVRIYLRLFLSSFSLSASIHHISPNWKQMPQPQINTNHFPGAETNMQSNLRHDNSCILSRFEMIQSPLANKWKRDRHRSTVLYIPPLLILFLLIGSIAKTDAMAPLIPRSYDCNNMSPLIASFGTCCSDKMEPELRHTRTAFLNQEGELNAIRNTKNAYLIHPHRPGTRVLPATRFATTRRKEFSHDIIHV